MTIDSHDATFADAELNAKAIEDTWRARGFPTVMAWPVQIGQHGSHVLWGVKSNLIAGIPPGSTAKAVAEAFRRPVNDNREYREVPFSG